MQIETPNNCPPPHSIRRGIHSNTHLFSRDAGGDSSPPLLFSPLSAEEGADPIAEGLPISGKAEAPDEDLRELAAAAAAAAAAACSMRLWLKKDGRGCPEAAAAANIEDRF